jgi:hypothetical protein
MKPMTLSVKSSLINPTILHVVVLAMTMLFDILSLSLHEITLSLLCSCYAFLVGLLSARHAVQKADTAEDDKKKSDAFFCILIH